MKTLFINLIIVLAAGMGFQGSVPETKVIPEKLPNNSYKAGEYLKYKVYYGWVNGGTATLTLTEKTVSGKTILYGRAYAKTIGTADQLFSVRDIYESYMDPESGLTLKSIRNVKEGSYKKYNEVLYNHTNNTIKSLLSGTKEVPDNIRDLVGAFYYFRRYDLNSMKVGEKIELETYFEDKVYPLELKYKGTESEKTKIGTFKCLKMVPIVETGGVFDDAEGDLTFYISADKNKIPIRVQVDFLVGSFKCDLIVYSGLKHELAKEDILK